MARTRKRKVNSIVNVENVTPDECAAEAWYTRLWRKVQTIEVAWCMGLLIACVVYHFAIGWCTTDLLPNYVVTLPEFRKNFHLGLFKLDAISDDSIKFIYQLETTACLDDENVICSATDKSNSTETDKRDSTRTETIWSYNFTHVHVSIPIHEGVLSEVNELKVHCSFIMPCVAKTQGFQFDIPLNAIRAEYKRVRFAVLTYILYAAALVMSIYALRNSGVSMLLSVLVCFAYLLYTPLYVTL